MKKIILNGFGLFMMGFLGGIILLSTSVYAESGVKVDGFNIMPKLEESEIPKVDQAIADIGKEGGKVWTNYNKNADSLSTSQQVASGIMNWNTILNYLVFVVKFLSQLGLFVGAVFIMYAGYTYMISVFRGTKTKPETLKNAIIGVIIVIFSYAIMKTLTSFIGLS